MKIFHKWFLWIICFTTIFISASFTIEAEDEEYYIADVSSGSIEKIESYNDFISANNSYLRNIKEYNNLVLYKNDKALKMEYGVVEFNSDDSCSLTVDYRSTKKNKDTSINGCQGVDGAYLSTDNNGNFVYFAIGGDIGFASIDNVSLLPYELLSNKISTYKNIEGDLYHLVKTNLDDDYYGKIIVIDKAYPLFKDDKEYYCYDNHYFYEDFKEMIDDYNNDTRENAINSDSPYYNYYEYLPFRSLTNYDYLELESYFYDTLMIKGKMQSYDDQSNDGANDVVNRSQYYGELKSFYEYQNIYGANALMSLSISINDSVYGKSLDSFVNNRLFNKLAFVSDEEIDTERYQSIEESIRAFDKYYVSNKFANHHSLNYCGTYFGNKASGINVNYSIDPYWGEIVSSNYYAIDKALGFKDYNSYCIGIVKKVGSINLYNEDDLQTIKFSLKNLNDYSFIILDETENSYKVQIDPSFSDEFVYSFDDCVAYIHKQIVDYIFNENNIHQNKMVNITFDGNGGTIDNKQKITINVLKGQTPVINNPKYDGYKFEEFDQDINKATNQKTYKVIYKEINEIKLNKEFDKPLEINSPIDIANMQLVVVYDDGSGDLIDLDSNMLDRCVFTEDGKQTLTINYCGKTLKVEINISKGLGQLREELKERLDKNLSSFNKNGTYSSDDLLFIKKNMNEINYDFNFNEVRMIDGMLFDEYKDIVNYRVEDNEYDLSVSGLALSLTRIESEKRGELLNDTYYVNVSDVKNQNKDILTSIGEAYGFEPVAFFRISYMLNMLSIKQEGPMVFSLNVPNKETNNIYTIYRIDDDGNIVKCKTMQTNNRIQFLTKKAGDFVMLTKTGVNSFNIPNYYENIASANSDPDSRVLFVMGWLLVALLVLGTAFIVFNMTTEGKRKAIWKDYKKSLQKAEYVPDEKPKN